ncbi:MAG: DUF3592 domain-containing protein [Erysipelotrichaceae bacterium]|nr:DUF3592 domain-containing protein [Erysipelotrichaceae bacterium]MDD6093496.1 DUF3592 domain-containing protein [bacterium]
MHFSYSTQDVQTNQSNIWQKILFGLIFVVVGIVLLYFAISSIKTYNEKSKTFIEITSTIVDYKYNDEGLQAIVVEYVVDGETYQKISNTYTNMPKSIGTEVPIKYNPNNPKDAIWVSDSNNIVLPIAGVAFTLVGIFFIVLTVKNEKKKKTIEEQTNELYTNTNIQPQPQMNNLNQPNSNVDLNNQNNNINTNS